MDMLQVRLRTNVKVRIRSFVRLVCKCDHGENHLTRMNVLYSRFISSSEKERAKGDWNTETLTNLRNRCL